MLVEQTNTNSQETLEFKMNKQMQTFSFSPPINFSEEGKWLLVVTSFETTNSVSIIIVENNGFSITTTGHWTSKSVEKTVDELNKSLELRSQNGRKNHVKKIRNRGNQMKIGDIE